MQGMMILSHSCMQAERARRIEKTLQEAVMAAISARCNCTLPDSAIGSGVFSCRGSQDTVTYRSTVTGLNASELVGHIQDWVGVGSTIVMDWYLVDVNSACPVGVSELDEPDCQLP